MRLKDKILLKLRLFKPQRAYENILLLGYNCETAFQFFQFYRFLESNLFAWTYHYSLQDTIHALQKLDTLGKNGFLPPDPLWECRSTHIRFHGQTNPSDTLQDEENELSGRVSYLKEKFYKTIKSPNCLFIVKVRTEEKEILKQRILALNTVLKKSTPTHFDLLVIAQSDCALSQNDFALTHLYVRHVKSFAPDDEVTNLAKSSVHDWESIFSEFGPAHFKKRTKRFKFENLS